jgi:hypothetical protein
MGRLTEPRLQDLLHAGKPVVIAVGDGTGLSFRIAKTDSKVTASWQLRYRTPAKRIGRRLDVTSAYISAGNSSTLSARTA